ncbi:MAG TPA: aldo/keto reductase [Phycisphaerales bacterium]|nr:aldo/keto reductase [Phycisphaerales bacterium]
MPLTDYVTLGRSGLRVSPHCLGTMTFGLDWGWGSTPEDSFAILDRFVERGGNFLDTANIYTKGHSERIIGDWIKARSARSSHHGGAHGVNFRDRLVIATKFMGNLYPGDPNGGGASRKAVIQQCEQSLRRLSLDTIDLYWMHFHDRHTPIEETMRALDDLVVAGKVRYIGFSDTPAWICAHAQTIADFRGWAPLVALQIEYSLAERSVEGDLIPMAVEMGLGVTPWSPLRGGVLTGKYTRADAQKAAAGQTITTEDGGGGRGAWVANHLTDRNFRIIDELRAIAADLKTTPAQVALAWVQERPGVAPGSVQTGVGARYSAHGIGGGGGGGSVIIGARTLKQLDDNLDALNLRLSPEHTARLDEVSRPTLSFPHDFLRYTVNNTQGGTTINRVPSTLWPMSPKNDDERW